MFLFSQKYLGISFLDIYKCPFFIFANICWKNENLLNYETIKILSVWLFKKVFQNCDDKFLFEIIF